jgi:hypothetical protein
MTAAGGLAAALLAGKGSASDSIRVVNDSLNGYATLAAGNRTVQVSCAVQHVCLSSISPREVYSSPESGRPAQRSGAARRRCGLDGNVGLEAFPSVLPNLEILLHGLFPFRSMSTIRFSRTAAWPYTFDSAYLRLPDPPIDHDQVMAHSPESLTEVRTCIKEATRLKS